MSPPGGSVQPDGDTNPTPSVSELRVNYSQKGLEDTDVAKISSPTTLFKQWLQDAVEVSEPEPNAMCLSTVSTTGRPSARYVLLKAIDERGFVWYTNYESRKAIELSSNTAAALTFWWPSLERSVRVEGDVVRVNEEESDAYFESRPPKSRLGAWASQQSRPLDDRKQLEQTWEQLVHKHLDDDRESLKLHIPRPEHWGGYRLIPTMIEFWKGRASRLHDRIVFRRDSTDDEWTRSRLQP